MSREDDELYKAEQIKKRRGLMDGKKVLTDLGSWIGPHVRRAKIKTALSRSGLTTICMKKVQVRCSWVSVWELRACGDVGTPKPDLTHVVFHQPILGGKTFKNGAIE